jgi:hypothetical protein
MASVLKKEYKEGRAEKKQILKAVTTIHIK